jgi:hypothetical protein
MIDAPLRGKSVPAIVWDLQGARTAENASAADLKFLQRLQQTRFGIQIEKRH